MKRFVITLLFIAGAFLMTACFGGSTTERVYFSVDYMLGAEQKIAERNLGSVIVQSFTSAMAYDRQEMVYRSNPYEFKYYWYKLWASKPRKMLQELYTKHLRQTGIFSDVSLTIEDQMPDFGMDVEILAIEELDVSDTEWYAHLAMRMVLTHFDSGATVWDYTFDVRRPVTNNEPVYVVKAMSELMDEELRKAFAELDVAVASGKIEARKQSTKKKIGPASHAPVNDDEADDILFESTGGTSAVTNEDSAAKDMPAAVLKSRHSGTK